MENEVKVILGKHQYNTEVIIGKHQLIIDEPEDLGGKDLGPKPTTLLLSSLGTCKAITMKMYADRKGWEIDKIEISLNYLDETIEGQFTTKINVNINIIGSLDADQIGRMLKISEKCPVQKILTNPINIQTNLLA